LPTSKGPPSSLVQLRTAVWTDSTRDTRPRAVLHVVVARGLLGRFERRIPLEDVEEDKVSAAFKNGVLTITVPKSAEAKNVRRIAINRNG
jgi:hypothetical protein